jgi:hypothetical protein
VISNKKIKSDIRNIERCGKNDLQAGSIQKFVNGLIHSLISFCNISILFLLKKKITKKNPEPIS